MYFGLTLFTLTPEFCYELWIRVEVVSSEIRLNLSVVFTSNLFLNKITANRPWLLTFVVVVGN